MEYGPEQLRAEEDVIDLRQLWLALLRRKWIVVGVCLLSVIAGYAFTKLATPIYEASTTLLIKDPSASGERMFLDGGGAVVTRNHLQNSVQMLRSRQVAEMAAARLGDAVLEGLEGPLRDYIAVQSVANTETIVVSAKHPHPQTAADIANAVADSFIEFNRELNRSELTVAREFIEEQLAVAEEQLVAAEQALQAYRETYGPVLPSDETRTILTRLGDLEARHLEAQLAYDDANRRGAASEMSTYAARMNALQQEIEVLEQRLAAVPEREMVLAALMREQTVVEQTFMLLRSRYEDVRIAEAMRTPNVAVIDAAVPPQSPVSPRPLLNLALAAFLGLFIGLGGVFVLEFLDTTVKSPDEVAQLVGLPVLGRIPKTGTLSERR